MCLAANTMCSIQYIKETLPPLIEYKIFHVLHDFSGDLTSAAIHEFE